MRCIIIDDNSEFAKGLGKELQSNGCSSKDFSITGVELYNIANDIIKQINDDTVILINVNLGLLPHKRLDYVGIELLKWLRLKKCYNHCILYSFQSHLQIIRARPLNSIMFSKGVTFIRLPFFPVDILSLGIKEKAERENLLPFFRSEIDLVGIRHELANIWGIERLKKTIYDNYHEDKTNFKISLLNYLNEEKISRSTPELKQKLSKLISWFKVANPSIYYYDDMAKEWGPVLNTILGTNFKYYTPQEKSPKNLIQELSIERPKCLLLDLRLKNEKIDSLDPLNLSGGKLLVDIKRKYFSLPIIMFSATNKAESVRRLLASGAEYVWTKEGIDDGIDDTITLQNTIDLLLKIKNCVFKFKNRVYEDIYAAEVKISTKTNADEYVRTILTNSNFQDYKTLIFDTNYLFDTLKNKGRLLKFHQLLLANNSLKLADRKNFVIHDDVFYELFKISKLKEEKNSNNDDFRVPVAQFLLKLLYGWHKKDLLCIDTTLGQQAAIYQTNSINFDLTPLERIALEEKTFFEKIETIFTNRLSIEIEEINKRIDEINTGVESISALKKIRLHFDDTLQEVVPKYLQQGGVLLITNDNTCAYNVGQVFTTSIIQEKHIYNCKFNPDDKEEITKMEGVKTATVNNFTYKHLLNGEFMKLF